MGEERDAPMPVLSACPTCATSIPADAPDGLCPRCVVSAALGPELASGGLGSLGHSMISGSGASARPTASVPEVSEVAELLPHLEVLEELGRGGMGVVYLARQPSLDRLVALKLLPRELGQDPAFSERFSREARALARLDHPNVVTIHDSGTAGGYSYFLMEYVDGSTLRDLMQADALTPGEALELLPQICAGLQFAHEQGLVHRDLKPENLLVTDDGRVKIADFGLAKLLGPERAGATLTLTHQVMGTPHYMAPEQIRGGEVDRRADVYALGVVLYELLTGELPIGRFGPPTGEAVVDAAVLRCLDADPERRFAEIREVQDALEGQTVPERSRPRATSLPASGDPTRLHRILDAAERGQSWSWTDYVGSVLTLGLLPAMRAEQLLVAHADDNEADLPESGPGDLERRDRYREAALGRTRGWARERRGLAAVLFFICLVIAVGGGVLLLNVEGQAHTQRAIRSPNGRVHTSWERNPRYWRKVHTGAGFVAAGGGLWVLILLSLLTGHQRAVSRHERSQLSLSILDNELRPAQAAAALGEHQLHWRRTAEVSVALTVLLLVSVPFSFGVLFLVWIAHAYRKPLELHLRREREVPALSGEEPLAHDTWLTFSQTRDVLGLDEGGLKALVIGGRLRGYRHGREMKFRRAEVAKLA